MRETYRIRLPDRIITTDDWQIAQHHKNSPWAHVERTGDAQ